MLTQDALLAQVAVTPEEVKAQYASARQDLHAGRAATGRAHSDRGQARRDRGRSGGREEDRRGPRRAGEGEPGQVRRDRQAALAGSGLGGAGRRSRQQSARHDGEALRRRGVRDEARRHRRPGPDRFGWHVIKLVGMTPAQTRPFEEVKAQIETELKRQKAAQKFAAAADQFQNLVYEQADSLAPVAKALGLKVQTTPLVTRAQAQQLAHGQRQARRRRSSRRSRSGQAQHRRHRGRAQRADGRAYHRIQAGGPAAFDDVKDEIRRQLVRQAATELAQKAGREKLALLEQGKSDKDAGVVFAKPVSLARNARSRASRPTPSTRIFQADAAKLPHLRRRPERAGRLRDLQDRQGRSMPPEPSRPSSRQHSRGSAKCRTARSSTPMSAR